MRTIARRAIPSTAAMIARYLFALRRGIMNTKTAAIGIDTRAKSICRKALVLSSLVCMKKPVARRITQKFVNTTESPESSLLNTAKNNMMIVKPMPSKNRSLILSGKTPSFEASFDALKKITAIAFKKMRQV